jgi:acyl dehydratase
MTKLVSRLEVTQDRIDRYGRANGDREMLHYDGAHARSRGFRGTIAHGTMLLAPLVDLALRRCGERFFTAGTLTVRWTAPVCAGETQLATLDESGAIEAVNEAVAERPVTLRATITCEGGTA